MWVAHFTLPPHGGLSALRSGHCQQLSLPLLLSCRPLRYYLWSGGDLGQGGARPTEKLETDGVLESLLAETDLALEVCEQLISPL